MQYFFQETAIKREREENCFNRFTKKKIKISFSGFFTMTLDSNRSFLDKNTSLIESQEETVIITHYIEVKKSIKKASLKNNFSSFLSSFKSVKQISKKLSSFLAQCVFCFVLILTKVYTLLFDQSRCNQVREKT